MAAPAPAPASGARLGQTNKTAIPAEKWDFVPEICDHLQKIYHIKS